MADEVDTTIFDDTEKIAKLEDSIMSGNRRSGNFNTLYGSPLYYPYDLLGVDITDNEAASGIVNWLEFRIFFKQNGSLTSLVKTVGEGIGNFTDEAGQFLDTALSGELTQIGQEQQNISGGGGGSEVTRDTRFTKATENSGDSIFLYVPAGIETSDSIKYEETGFGGLKGLSNASAAGGVVALGALRKLAGGVDKVAGVVGQESMNAGAALSAELGVVLNPRKEQVFQGIEMRNFNFNFVFIPRSEEEAQTVARIVKLFRFHAYPELSSNSAFFQFPSEFEIKYRSLDTSNGNQRVIDNPVLPKMNRCVLEKITTNYTPDETFYSFKNGMPPKITMQLSFKETEFITRQHINEGY